MFPDLDKSANKLLLILLFADLVFIVVHILFRIDIVNNELFSIERDHGYAEVYQYIKEFWIVVLLLLLAVLTRHMMYGAWSLLFTVMLLDDSLALHENMGGRLVKSFGLSDPELWVQRPEFLNLRPQDLGELSVTLFSGIILFILIWTFYRFSDNRGKQVSRNLLIAVLVLLGFGIGVDMIHEIVPWGNTIVGGIEDGGEMLVMSVIVSYVFGLKVSRKPPDGNQTTGEMASP